MARIDDLLLRVADPQLRAELSTAVDEVRRTRDFGLVFESHLPESARLYTHPVRRGVKVALKSANDRALFSVTKVAGPVAKCIPIRDSAGAHVPVEDQAPVELSVGELVVVAEFGDPIYPGLKHLGGVHRGVDKPAHVVINAENHHALEALQFTHAGRVDCIYIDPPYNTGARDWKYNNDYVDDSDSWRHSKWLAMVERRLLLAKRLLASNGVLIVTIDENELLHLGMLLETIFSSAVRQLVTICINPGGASGVGLSRVEEYAFFVFLGDARPVETADDMLSEESDGDEPIRWEWLMRGGSAWYRSSRPNLCYPILLDDKGERILGVGPPLDGSDETRRPERVDGKLAAWPVRSDGKLGIWRVDGKKLETLAEKGYAYVSREDPARGTWTIKYLLSGTVKEIEDGQIRVLGETDRGQAVLERTGSVTRLAKTVWNRPRHNAGGVGGTHLLTAQLGERGLFSFPKSIYSTLDCLQVAVGDRSDAVVLDFFGGSGTTLNAVMLMNDADGGSRRAIVVTNNEVSAETGARLLNEGHHPGDEAFEAQGIFQRVTQPRCRAAVTGQRPDGMPTKGKYLNGKSYEEGFEENVEFLELTYQDSSAVELDLAFESVAPLLWLRAGGQGRVIDEHPDAWEWTDRYGVLIDTDAWQPFVDARPEAATAAFIVTDSPTVFASIAAELPSGTEAVRLYESYLTTFAINQADA